MTFRCHRVITNHKTGFQNVLEQFRREMSFGLSSASRRPTMLAGLSDTLDGRSYPPVLAFRTLVLR